MERKNVSTMEQFFAESSGREVWGGVDVHKRSYSVRHSGEKTPSGHLRPTGQSRLRSLLVEAAWA